jgi:hypothetical protein
MWRSAWRLQTDDAAGPTGRGLQGDIARIICGAPFDLRAAQLLPQMGERRIRAGELGAEVPDFSSEHPVIHCGRMIRPIGQQMLRMQSIWTQVLVTAMWQRLVTRSFTSRDVEITSARLSTGLGRKFEQSYHVKPRKRVPK